MPSHRFCSPSGRCVGFGKKLLCMFSRDGEIANVPNFAAQVNCGSTLSRSLKTRHCFGFLARKGVVTATAAKLSSCRKSSMLHPCEAVRLLCVSESGKISESVLFLSYLRSTELMCACACVIVSFRCHRLSLDGLSLFLRLERAFFAFSFFSTLLGVTVRSSVCSR